MTYTKEITKTDTTEVTSNYQFLLSDIREMIECVASDVTVEIDHNVLTVESEDMTLSVWQPLTSHNVIEIDVVRPNGFVTRSAKFENFQDTVIVDIIVDLLNGKGV